LDVKTKSSIGNGWAFLKPLMDSKLKKKRYDQRVHGGNGKVHLRITMAHTLPNT
jgi:hypothetical protein